MVVPRLVILHGTALDALLGYIECDVNQTIFTPFRCENTKLDRKMCIRDRSNGRSPYTSSVDT